MGRGNEPRSDQSASGGEGGSGQNHANPEATECNASVPVQERHGRCTAPHQDVRRLHHLLPERSVMQRVHRSDPPKQECPEHPRSRPFQPFLPDAVVLQQVRVCGALLHQGVDGEAGCPRRG